MKRARSINREFLDKAKCPREDCAHDDCILYIHPKCHPHGGIEASYDKAAGECIISCARCRDEIVRLEIR